MTTNRSLTLAWRAFIIVATFVLAYAAGANAIVNVTRTTSPETALAIDPTDPIALAVLADIQWAGATESGKVIDVSEAARESLRGQAINPRAVRLLAFSADTRGDQKRAAQLNLIAAKLSRRESGAQLWLMEQAVERNDVRAALVHYDMLLRTNDALRAQLYSKLALALSDPEIRAGFVPYVRQAPFWLPSFIDAAAVGPNPDALSFVIRQAGGLPKTVAYRSHETLLLNQLFVKQKFAEARAFYATLSGADLRATTSAAFTDVSVKPELAPISWIIDSQANAGATLEKSGKAWAVQVFALSGEAGTALSKYLFIPPGTYRFGSLQSIITPSANSRAAWVLRCASTPDQAIIYQYDIIRTPQTPVPSAQVIISSTCPVQRLELTVAGGDNSGGLEMRVTNVEIGR